MRRHLEERFDGFPVTGLTLLRWMYDTKAEALSSLSRLLAVAEKAGRQDEVHRLHLLKDLLTDADENADILFASAGLAKSRAGAIAGP